MAGRPITAEERLELCLLAEKVEASCVLGFLNGLKHCAKKLFDGDDQRALEFYRRMPEDPNHWEMN